MNKTTAYVGFFSSILTTAVTIITFGVALIAVPISGAFCPGKCIGYPYVNTFERFPNDFLWMYLAILLSVIFIFYMTSLHYIAEKDRRILTKIGLNFACMSSLILIVDYFIQGMVVPMSLAYGETEGIPILIQYNAHGIFIAMETVGLLLMSLSFFLISYAFSNENRIEAFTKWFFRLAFVLSVLFFVILLLLYGFDIQDRFEVIVISINWSVLIINGILASIVFKKKLKGF